jgi:hypothetical protein
LWFKELFIDLLTYRTKIEAHILISNVLSARDSWFFFRESLARVPWPLSCAPLRIIKARSHCYNGWRGGRRESVCNCRGVRGQIIFPRRIVNTARCLARIKSAAGHSPIMHLCILCITRMGHYFPIYAYIWERGASHFARTDADVRSLFLRDYWKKVGCNHILLFSALLIMMNACTHYFCAHSFRRGWWVTSFVVASGPAADARQTPRTVARKSVQCLFALAERWWGRSHEWQKWIIMWAKKNDYAKKIDRISFSHILSLIWFTHWADEICYCQL